MSWGLQFSSGRRAGFSTWTATGDFSLSGKFYSGSLSTNEVIISQRAATHNYIAQYTNGDFELRIGATSFAKIAGGTTNTEYEYTVDRVGSSVTFEVVGVGSVTQTKTGTVVFDTFGDLSVGLQFTGQLRGQTSLDNNSGDVRTYDVDLSDHSNTGAQPVLVDTIGGNNAVGVDFPTDGSAWVDLGGSGITLEVDSGTYSSTGADISLRAAFKSAIDNGTYNLSGKATNLIVDSKVIAKSGSYSLTGSDADLIAARKTIIESGDYNLTGSSVDLIYTPSESGESISVDSGSFTLNGADVGLIVNRRTAIEEGNYSLTGQSIQLTYNSNIATGSGVYALTGQDITLFASYVTISTSGSYSLTGYPVTLRYSGDVSQVIGSVSTSFADDRFTANYKPNSITVNFKA